MGLFTADSLAKKAARADVRRAKAALREAVRQDARTNMSRPGSVMDYPESEAYLTATARLKAAKRALRRAR